jgi:hypothetical protein
MSLSKQNTKPKYCKVCHDTGKDEKTYTSHYVRETPDPTSRIVCPTLLSMECKYCYKKGHTVKHCKVIKTKSHQQQRASKPSSQKADATTNTNISKNIYDLLDCCEEEQTQHETRTAPEPVSAPFSYAKIIAVTHKQVAEEEMDRLRKQAEEHKQAEERKQAEAEQQMIKSVAAATSSSYFKPMVMRKMLNWADDTSSDEEDLNQEEEYAEEQF